MLQNCTKKIVLISLGMLLAGCAVSEFQLAPRTAAGPVNAPAGVQKEYRAALERLEANDDVAAASQFERFVATYPQYPGAYANLAIIYDRQDRTEEAVWLLNQAIALDSGTASAAAWNRLGLIKRRQGQFTEAEAAWQGAVTADPGYAYAWYNLGVLYDLYLQDLPAALDHYRRYQQLSNAAEQDAVVARWIADLERRIGAPAQAARLGEEL